jgi:hypothetical protein
MLLILLGKIRVTEKDLFSLAAQKRTARANLHAAS